MVWINTAELGGPELPFGGTKRSGVGRELGALGIDEFVKKKLIHTPPPRSDRGGAAGSRCRCRLGLAILVAVCERQPAAGACRRVDSSHQAVGRRRMPCESMLPAPRPGSLTG
jgi:hypothetical protein